MRAATERPLSRFMPDGMPRDVVADPGGRGAQEFESSEDLRVGEVVEASTTELVAQARELHGAPFFGRFVTVKSDVDMFGIVFNASTRSIEPNRRPTAYGKTEEQLRLEQPQIFELLRTHFSVLVTGYLDDDGVPVHGLPPQPARIHSFVYRCDEEQVREFSEEGEYLRCILNAPAVPTDDLVIAALRFAMKSRGAIDGEVGYLERVGKDLARILSGDYNRLTSLMRRIESSARRTI